MNEPRLTPTYLETLSSLVMKERSTLALDREAELVGVCSGLIAARACSSFSILLLINQASFVLQLLSVAIQSILSLLIRRWLWGQQAPCNGQLMPHSGGFEFQNIAPNGKGMNAGREGKVSIKNDIHILVTLSFSNYC